MRARAVSREEIRQILALPDRRLRNQWITQTYWDLAQSLQPKFGADATWLSFAMLASQTAGSLLGQDALFQAIAARNGSDGNALARGLRWLIDAVGLRRFVDQVTRAVADYTADGNRMVFDELAPLFLALAHGDDRALNAAPESLRPAFRRYLAAAREKDDKTRAELILLANLETVCHEQRRLDSRIRGALDAVVDNALRWLAGLRWLGPLRDLLTEIVERVETDRLMTLRTRSGALPLSRDLRRMDGESLYLPPLDPIVSPDLLAFLASWNAAGRSGQGSGAENWASLEERMEYLCALFRSYQRDKSLFSAPFSEAQLEILLRARHREHT